PRAEHSSWTRSPISNHGRNSRHTLSRYSHRSRWVGRSGSSPRPWLFSQADTRPSGCRRRRRSIARCWTWHPTTEVREPEAVTPIFSTTLGTLPMGEPPLHSDRPRGPINVAPLEGQPFADPHPRPGQGQPKGIGAWLRLCRLGQKPG